MIQQFYVNNVYLSNSLMLLFLLESCNVLGFGEIKSVNTVGNSTLKNNLWCGEQREHMASVYQKHFYTCLSSYPLNI